MPKKRRWKYIGHPHSSGNTKWGLFKDTKTGKEKWLKISNKPPHQNNLSPVKAEARRLLAACVPAEKNKDSKLSELL